MFDIILEEEKKEKPAGPINNKLFKLGHHELQRYLSASALLYIKNTLE